MRKLKLTFEMLTVNTFGLADDAATRSIYYPTDPAEPNTRFCSEYESYCTVECGSDTISYDPCTRGTTV